MKILVSNDDGVCAPGLAALATALSEIGELLVVAPDRNCSGASNALTLDRPLEAYQHDNGFYSVNGTPTDCVHLGCSGVLGMLPDIVVSGINSGPNLGDDVIYSGTVAAAIEGRHRPLPAIAISTSDFHPKYYDVAAMIARDLVKNIHKLNVAPRTVLNVNVPDRPYEEINGVHITRLGHRTTAEHPIATQDPRGKTRYWIAGTGPALDKGPGTDFYAIAEGVVSVTPLHTDMTQYSGMDNLGDWLESNA